jgi:hypothetical protein
LTLQRLSSIIYSFEVQLFENMGLSLNVLLKRYFQNSRKIFQEIFEVHAEYELKKFLKNFNEFWELQPK